MLLPCLYFHILNCKEFEIKFIPALKYCKQALQYFRRLFFPPFTRSENSQAVARLYSDREAIFPK